MTKPLINQVSEGIQHALGLETKSDGEFVPKITKLPTVKVPLSADQKKAAYAKRKKKAAFNRQFSNLQKGQKNTNALNKRLQKGVNLVNQKSREHAAMKRTISSNQRAIAALKKELAIQKRYASMLMLKWEKKNKAQLQRMTENFRKQLKESQAKAFTAYAKQQLAKKKKSSSVKSKAKVNPYRHRKSTRPNISKRRAVISSPGKKSSMVKKRPINRLRKQPIRKITSRPTVKRAAIRRIASRTAPKPALRRVISRPAPQRPGIRKIVSRPTVKRPAIRRIASRTAPKPALRRVISRPAPQRPGIRKIASRPTIKRPAIRRIVSRPSTSKRPVYNRNLRRPMPYRPIIRRK